MRAQFVGDAAMRRADRLPRDATVARHVGKTLAFDVDGGQQLALALGQFEQGFRQLEPVESLQVKFLGLRLDDV